MQQMKKIIILSILLIILCNTSNSSQQQSIQHKQQQSVLQYNQQRLQEINFLINSYFANCKFDQESKLLYDCSILKQNYAEFIYGLFHKQLILNFLKLYHIQGQINQNNQLQAIMDLGDQVHAMAINAYNDWIEIYKPNKEITVDQMYQDIPDLDSQVLDVIQHNQPKHQDMIDVLKKVYKIKSNYKKYIIMGNKSEQQIAQDYSGILDLYFGDCSPISKCSMPLNRFVYFVKQLSFYITPLANQSYQQSSILVSEEMDFKATEFLIEKVNQLKLLLGNQVDYDQIQAYSQDIAMSLFSYLKDQKNQSESQEAPQNSEEKQPQNQHQL